MMLRHFGRNSTLTLFVFFFSSLFGAGQGAPSNSAGGKLEFVVYLSRHGVRSPTGKASKYNEYAAAPWPEWDVPPGYLTPHGYALMKLFGAYDRAMLAGEGLLAAQGCGDAAHISIVADSDQRTRETGKAIGEGLLPGCALTVQARPEGTADPLFHALEAGVGNIDHALAAAAIAGRIGGDAANPVRAYRPQLAALERILQGCGRATAAAHERTSIFDVPGSLGPGAKDHPAELRGPLATASTLSENLLLEYTEGMPPASVGWGCVDAENLREVMQLHEAEADLVQRTPAIARMYASNLLDQMVRSMEQAVTGKPVAGAPGRPGDRLLILVGHDTNIATVAGTLGLTWIVDGRRDDTPPGGALEFEIWSSPTGGKKLVRAFYTAQTIDQMREGSLLTLDNPPPRAPLFVPGCSTQDLSCTWDAFAAAAQRAIDPNFVAKPR